jgi:hypothetical protein
MESLFDIMSDLKSLFQQQSPLYSIQITVSMVVRLLKTVYFFSYE